jgi:hypothetical protein
MCVRLLLVLHVCQDEQQHFLKDRACLCLCHLKTDSVSVSVSLKDVVAGMCLSPLVQYVRFSLSLLGVRFRVMGFGFRAAGSRA